MVLGEEPLKVPSWGVTVSELLWQQSTVSQRGWTQRRPAEGSWCLVINNAELGQGVGDVFKFPFTFSLDGLDKAH